ncbi:DUF5784 family protein [Halomarina halobia]|uniref:DUF5784 family protein n=1 Tax=Halomarina halobia TaxID=3033386 RepID=A0ABD6A8D6_9EURY|nr:DUF5784 family protein [Halomarina sp. PSR21]
MAGPLRFRRSHARWTDERVRRDLLAPLDESFGATVGQGRFGPPKGYRAHRIDMNNGDVALFAWRHDPQEAFWLGNTTTPEALWRTEKCGLEEAPYPVSRWAQRELLADLEEQDPELAAYRHVSWFFLPVFFSKDGRTSTRRFFTEHAAGFPDADPETALRFYEEFLRSGVLDPCRETMAGKLGTSPHVDHVRMNAAMGELNAAKLLHDAGHEFVPEIALDSGHALDFAVGDGVRAVRADGGGHRTSDALVEVTRPLPPSRRTANTPVAAVRATANAKTDDQLDAHPDALLLVDCSSFRDDDWNTIRAEQPPVKHTPAVIYRMRPNGSAEAYAHGDPGIDLGGAVRWA